jgi:hypothetical protein
VGRSPCCIKEVFGEDKSAIEKETPKRGKFVVATNELDSEKLSD